MKIIAKYEDYNKIYKSKYIESTVIPSHEQHICLNCENTYTGNYCNQCGQSHNTARITLGKMARNLINGITNVDNGFFYSIIGLCTYPGVIISNYLKGKRASHFQPFQMLFILASIYSVIVLLFSSEPANIDDLKDSVIMDGTSSEKFVFLNQIMEWVNFIFYRNLAMRNIMAVPLFALAAKIAFYKEIKQFDYNIAELFYIMAFIATQQLIFALIYLPFDSFSKRGLAWWFQILLSCWVFNSLFKGNIIKLSLKTLLMYVIWILLIIAMVCPIALCMYIIYPEEFL